MSEKYEAKATVSFRVDPKLMESFKTLTENQMGYGGLSKILHKLIRDYVEKYDGIKEGNRVPSPPIMDEFESSLKHFIKTLDIEINPTPKKHEYVFDGPLQYFINNLEDAIIYAKALRAMRFLHNYNYQSQLETQLTLSEAVDMIINEKMEKYFTERYKRI